MILRTSLFTLCLISKPSLETYCRDIRILSSTHLKTRWKTIWPFNSFIPLILLCLQRWVNPMDRCIIRRKWRTTISHWHNQAFRQWLALRPDLQIRLMNSILEFKHIHPNNTQQNRVVNIKDRRLININWWHRHQPNNGSHRFSNRCHSHTRPPLRFQFWWFTNKVKTRTWIARSWLTI